MTTLIEVKANGNGMDGGDAGLKIRKTSSGNLSANVTGVELSNNVIGGISVREDVEAVSSRRSPIPRCSAAPGMASLSMRTTAVT